MAMPSATCGGSPASALIEVLRDPARFVRPRPTVVAAFDLEHSLRQYEELFEAVRR